MKPGNSRQRTRSRPPKTAFACPACQALIESVFQCPNCGFTGQHSMEMFPGTPPQPQPVNDRAGLWSGRDLRRMERARRTLAKRFPQFRWSFCTVTAPPEANLRLLGFWMLNAAPLAPDESERDRYWTVLLLINSTDHRAAVIPGYAAEMWLPNDRWDKALEAMVPEWQAGQYGKAVRNFTRMAAKLLETSWKRSNMIGCE